MTDTLYFNPRIVTKDFILAFKSIGGPFDALLHMALALRKGRGVAVIGPAGCGTTGSDLRQKWADGSAPKGFALSKAEWGTREVASVGGPSFGFMGRNHRAAPSHAGRCACDGGVNGSPF